MLSRFSSDPKSVARVIRFNMLIVLLIFLIILVPLVYLVLSSGPVNPLIIVVFLPVFLLGGISLASSWSAGRRRPTVAFVTDRRVIVESFARQASSAAIGLETVGAVQLDQSARAMRRAGVCWLYILPMGTTVPLVGSGRYRQPAPGVVWMAAVPMSTAQALKSLVVQQAHDVQVRLGYPNPIVPE